MTARPILFSAPMVRALLAGRKTQTRRIVKARHPISFLGGKGCEDDPSEWGWFFDGPDHHGYAVIGRDLDERHDHGRISIPCPYGDLGDSLWVKETWRAASDLDDKSPSAMATACVQEAGYARAWAPIEYVADGEHRDWRPWGTGGGDATAGRVRSPLHMPRWASRITLRVTSVRVERLQAITEDDAKAEGVTPFPDDPEGDCWTNGKHRTAFEYLWNEINGWSPNAWQLNPWVWVVGFEVQP